MPVPFDVVGGQGSPPSILRRGLLAMEAVSIGPDAGHCKCGRRRFEVGRGRRVVVDGAAYAEALARVLDVLDRR